MNPFPGIYWRSVIRRIGSGTLLNLLVLVAIFVLMDFSENSDDFSDNGASLGDIFRIYYANYLPEMVRLILPVAVFVAVLFVVGRMSERLEIAAYKAAGVRIAHLILPMLVLSSLLATGISLLDSELIPASNQRRIEFESRYISGRSDRLEKGTVFRQESPTSVLKMQYYDAVAEAGYQFQLIEFNDQEIIRWTSASRATWVDSLGQWRLRQMNRKEFSEGGFEETDIAFYDTTLAITPKDLSRRTTDIFRLSYKEAREYIRSMERLGIGHLALPVVQFYGRLFYPLSIIVVTLIGFSISSGRFRQGKGFQIAIGLFISFLYLTLMKIAEPFGATGVLPAAVAAFAPHGVFLLVALALVRTVRG